MKKLLTALTAVALVCGVGAAGSTVTALEKVSNGRYVVEVAGAPAAMAVGEVVQFSVVVSPELGNPCIAGELRSFDSPEVRLDPSIQPVGSDQCGFLFIFKAFAEAEGTANLRIDFVAGRELVQVPFQIVVEGADVIAPMVDIEFPVDSAVYTETEIGGASPQFTCVDDVAVSSCTQTGFSGNVGVHTMTVTGVDTSGNAASASVTYEVVADPPLFTFDGFYEPADVNAVNTIKGGRTVPLKFNVYDGDGVEVTDPALIGFSVAYSGDCGNGVPTDAVEATTTGGTSLRYDPETGQFVQNWKTPRGAGQCLSATVSIDGASLSATFLTR